MTILQNVYAQSVMAVKMAIETLPDEAKRR